MIGEFQGAYRFLSNFYPAEVVLSPDGYEELTLPTVEHAYQALKAGNVADFCPRAGVTYEQYTQMTPGQAKRLGRGVTLRSDWGQVKVAVMLGLLRQKFAHPHLAEMLLATSDEVLVEGNRWHDTFWGKCHCPRHRGKGLNQLGKLLMQVRKEIRGLTVE